MQMILLYYAMEDIQQKLEVGILWTVHEVHQEIVILFVGTLNSDFDILIVSGDRITNVNARNEK